MATKKKSSATKKQSVSSARPRSYSELYKDDKTRTAQVYTATSRKIAAPQETPSAVQTLDWREEYVHVVRDLRMLLTVSAVLFAIIIVIGFFF
jgi:ABC-type lipoprotein release transport system permease subunit